MPLETGTYISDLVPSNPTIGDLVSAGDDHIRLLKATIRNTFPSIAGAVSATHTELSYLAGVTSSVQSQLNAKSAIGHTHLESEIQDGNVFARIFGTETIQGSWNFLTLPTFNGSGFFHAASAIPEANIADGSLLARVGGNEVITGNWNFTTPPTINSLGTMRWATTGLTSGRVYLQNGGSPPGTGTPGDVVLIY